ncbi:substrate import-associated zinc metallohydrolase lipoprotein [Niabella sp. 22666]|uniref:substrate import-associated zinc metallohydrolase lipoprotein n=1 Tax=Niabella sp. 22666 TaxID=3453954 RepID=UPI003F84D199
MKKIKIYIVAAAVLTTLMVSCRKSDTNLDVDMSDYPQNITTTNEMDTWLTNNFTTPWNILVQYRYDRGKQGEVIRNVTPVDMDRIKPAMQMILDNFIAPYKKVGGETFGKTYFHKEWVLFGSPSYNNDGSYTVGTSSNARTMTLYDLNTFNITNLSRVQWYTHVVHHEFTHALNQTIPIPPTYARVSAGDYEPDWVGGDTATANSLGFVSPYARSSFTEDFAEFVATFVTAGPVRYSNTLNRLGANSVGYTRLKQKEAIVYEYMKNNFNVDIYALQADTRNQLKTIYGITDPVDITQTFPFQLAGNKVNTITVNPTAAHYTTYGSSAAFNNIITSYRDTMQANNFYMDRMEFIFTGPTTMSYRVYFRQGVSGTTIFVAEWNFNYTVNTTTGAVQFIKVIPESSTLNNNRTAAGISSGFEKIILPYLTNRQFIAAYLPTTITPADPLYKTFAGFYVNGTPASYFYGPVTYK